MLVKKKPLQIKKMLGAYLPQRFHTYLTLYGVAHNRSKNELIEKLILRWVNYECRYAKPKRTEEALMKMIGESFRQQWIIAKTMQTPFEKFKKDCRAFLHSKRLPPEIIANIINNLKE